MSLEKKSKRELLANLLQKKLEKNKAVNPIQKFSEDKIAIVGLSGRYPMADDIDSFWNNLQEGKDCVTDIPKSRWNWEDYVNKADGDLSQIKGGFINDVDKFDPQFFGIAPREAIIIDPQERLFLQTAWHTIEDAGYTPKTLANSSGKVGVFVGVMNSNYSILGSSIWNETQKTENVYICNPTFWSVANRVSYCLNFNGPSLALDTACSSSLTAIHLACESIKRKECDAAIAGGVNLILHPAQLEILSKRDMLSQRGKCHSFGKDADGFIDGEGVGAILLKPLNKALEDGDHIYGIIKGSSINSGGRTRGFTVPNPNAQADLITSVIEQAQVNPRSISYIEAHGTGTSLGDPIEVRGLAKAFGAYTEDKQFCALGSVKANIGHLEAAAGVSGITKILLQMKHNVLVPTINSTEENEFIDLKSSPFYLQKTKTQWNENASKIAGISSFGAGGSNAHIILQSYEDALIESVEHDISCFIPVSAAHKDQVAEQLKSLISYVEKNRKTKRFSLLNLSHTLIVGREDQPCRLAFVVKSLDEFIAKANQHLRGESDIAQVYEAKVDKNKSADRHFTPSLDVADLTETARLWVAGSIEKPTQLYRDLSPKRISLPGYPFLKESYWVPVNKSEHQSVKQINNRNDVVEAQTPNDNQNISDSISDNSIGTLYLAPVWQDSPLASGSAMVDLGKNVLVFSNDNAHFSTIKRELNNASGASDITFIQAGKLFSALKDHRFSVDSESKEDLDTLLNLLSAKNGSIDTILYAWPGDSSNSDSNHNDADVQTTGILPLLNLMQLINEKRINAKVVVWSVNQGRLADLSSLAYSGFVKSVLAERQNLSLKHVIFESNEDHSIEFQLSALVAELAQSSGSPSIIKYVNGQRKVEVLEETPLLFDTNNLPAIKKNGAYLVTGGVGGLGKLFAQRIASYGNVKLALTGRSELNESNRAFVESLKSNNNEVVYYRCDLTLKGSVDSLFEKIRNRFIQLDGVIYSAGVIKDCLINNKNWADFKTVIDTKIKGITYVDAQTSTMPLDFFVAFSSVSSVIGNIGQTDYAYANTYLDEFCKWRVSPQNRTHRFGKSISINWPLWSEGGMHVSKQVLQGMEDRLGIKPLSSDEGLNIFDAVVASELTQLVPLHGVVSRIKNTLQKQVSVDAAVASHVVTATVESNVSATQLSVALESTIKQMISNILQLASDRIDPHQGLGEFGFDSIILREFASKIKATFGVDLSPAVFFSQNTMAKICNHLIIEYRSDIERSLSSSLPVSSNTQVANTAQPNANQNPIVIDRSRMFERSKSAAVGSQAIAIIGMDGIFPGAENLEAFWHNLSNGIDPISEIPAQRWNWQDYYGNTFGASNKTNSKWGGFIPNIEEFDYGFFGLSEHEALHMDPQQRLFLQATWKTIENAGYEASSLQHQDVGVFVGVEFSDYKDYLDQQGIKYSAELAIGNSLNMIPNRVSYYFDFNGPSETIDTACSGSLVAVNRAVRAIQSGECSVAIAGGVSVILSPKTMVGTSQLNIYSPDGRCKTFDKDANGYVKGEGVGAILLKSLDDALRDGDNILAVIKGSAINHGGRSNSITAPNPAAQAKLLLKAYKEAGVNAEQVSYIEMHGTGTNLGDPIEVEGIKSAFKMLADQTQQPTTKFNYCGIGSVKSNIGHLEPASGIAGLIKVILSMKARELPANLHFNELNPFIKLEKTPFYIVDKKQTWQRSKDVTGNELPLVAGVSSFGFGGANAHVVIEEWVAPVTHVTTDAEYLFVLSAKNADQLNEYVRSMIQYMQRTPVTDASLRNIVYTLQVGRQAMDERLAFVVRNQQDLLEALNQFLVDPSHSRYSRGSKSSNSVLVRDLIDDSLQHHILTNKNLSLLAKWWVLGVDFTWSQLYNAAPAQRLPLPTYPFAKTRCWITGDVQEQRKVSEPIIVKRAIPEPVKTIAPAQTVKTSDVQTQVYEKVSKIAGVSLSEIKQDLHLAADLGLDSIKMMSLINELISSRPQNEMEYFNSLGMNSIVGQAQTLSGLVDIFKKANSQASNLDISSPIDSEVSSVQELNVPLSDSQYLFLPAHFLTKSSSLCSYVEIKGKVDIDVANKVWKKLIDRHPVLQLGFTWPNKENASFSDVKVSFEDQVAPLVKTVDISSLSSGEQAEAIQAAFEERLNYQWDLEQWPLHDFSVYKKSDAESVLFWSNEHIISDGLSNQQALREFLELYESEMTGKKVRSSSFGSRESYSELITRINSYLENDERAETQSNAGVSGSYCFNPENKERNIENAKFVCLKKTLDKKLTQELVSLTKRSGFSFNTLLTTAFLNAVAKFDTTSQDILIQVPTSGRIYQDLDLTNVMGCFAQNLSIAFNRSNSGEDIATALDRVQNLVNESLVYGADIKQARELGNLVKQMRLTANNKLPKYAVDMLLDSVKSNLYFPYTGQTGIKAQYADLVIAKYAAGTSNSPGSIDLLQEIFQEELHLFVNYDSSFFSQTIIESIVSEYIRNLETFTQLSFAQNAADVNAVDSGAKSEFVLNTARNVLNSPINAADLEKDLEADLGFDSIDRIKLVTQLHAQDRSVNRSALIKCRSLADMARYISGQQIPTSSAQACVEKVSAVAPLLTQHNQAPLGMFKTPIEQITYQASLTPDAIAVTHQHGSSITYAELNERANQIAHQLKLQNIGAGDFVGLLSNRGPLMLTGIVAIMKAGAAYVPIDPSYPVGRMRYILNHARIKTLLIDPSLTDAFNELYTASSQNDTGSPSLTDLILLDYETDAQLSDFKKEMQGTITTAAVWGAGSTENLTQAIDPLDNMVVLFTSGSTGNPKGVLLNHEGYQNRLEWHQKMFQLQPGEKVAQKTSCCFDVAIWELLWPLMYGGVVCAVEKDTVSNPWDFADWLEAESINVAHFVPSMFGAFTSTIVGENRKFSSLRWLIFSGEALATNVVQDWIDEFGLDIGLCNLYGPTEASIDVTYHVIEERPADAVPIPIGKAVDNVFLVVIDEEGKAVPVGEKGELCLGGIQLAKGYLYEPELTSKAFIPNKLTHIPCDILYRTGDLASEDANGSFNYHGRIDSQVKIRGFRVELGEIENIASSHKNINEAAVLVVNQGGTDKLVMWYAGEETDEADIKAFINERCTDYMVPHFIYRMESLPKNSNGKLDRKVLRASLQETKANSTDVAVTEVSAHKTLPVGPAQKWIFNYFDAPYNWFGSSRLHFTNTLNVELFNRALDEIVVRYDALRTIFNKDGTWNQVILSECSALELEQHDFSHVSEAELDKNIVQLSEKMAESIKIDSWPLCRFAAIKLHDNTHEILWVAHHLISDLVTGQLLMRELWSIYADLVEGKPISSATSVNEINSYANYIERLQQDCVGHKQKEIVEYWTRHTYSVQKPIQIPVDYTKGDNLESSGKNLVFAIDNDIVDFLHRQAGRQYECTFYHLLSAPLYKFVATQLRRSWVVLSHKLSGRNIDQNTHHYFECAGNFAVNAPMGISVNKNAKYREIVEAIKTEFSSMPLGGASYDWVSDQLAETAYPDNKLTSIRVNYLGDISSPVDQLFSSAPEKLNQRLSLPNQKRTSLLEFFFYSKNRETYLEISYSDNFYKKGTIEKIATGYLKNLGALVKEAKAEKSSVMALAED